MTIFETFKILVTVDALSYNPICPSSCLIQKDHYFFTNFSMMLPYILCSFFIPLRYCPSCKTDSSEVVKAGEKLKMSKKKAKMPSASTESRRDWGRVKMKLPLNFLLTIHSRIVVV